MLCQSNYFDFFTRNYWTLHASAKSHREMTVNTASRQTLKKIMSLVFRVIICWFNFARLLRPLLHVKGIKLRNNALWMLSSAAFADRNWQSSKPHTVCKFSTCRQSRNLFFCFRKQCRKSKIMVMHNKGTNAYTIRNFRRVKKKTRIRVSRAFILRLRCSLISERHCIKVFCWHHQIC